MVRGLWLLTRDSNEMNSLDEQDHRGLNIVRRCSNFKYWIRNNGLIDLDPWNLDLLESRQIA